jgi:hypothetical protein
LGTVDRTICSGEAIVEVGGIIRRILIRLLLEFSQPPPNAVWYRRFLPLLVLLVVIVGAIVMWTAGTPVLVDYIDRVTGTPSTRTAGIGVRASLVVAWIAAVGFAWGRSASIGYRLESWSWRNPWLAAALLVVFGALVAHFVLNPWPS